MRGLGEKGGSVEHNDTDELRTLIEREIAKLDEKIAGLEAQTKPIAPDNAIGRLTRMEAIQAKSVNASALARAKTKRRQLEQTLPKLEDATFGDCQRCGRPIPPKRLMLMPESPFCMRCAGR